MADDEALRETLIELDALRKREQATLREQAALVACLSAVTRAPNAEKGFTDLLAAVMDALDCDMVALARADENGATALFSTSEEITGGPVPQELLKGRKPRRFVSVAALDWWRITPAWPSEGSALSASIMIDGAPGALICAAPNQHEFSAADSRILGRLSEVVAQAWTTVEMSRRNTLLAGVIDGSAASVSIADMKTPGAPLIYINEAFTQLSGYSEKEVLGRNCRFLSAEDPDSSVRTALRAAVENAEVGEFELRNRKKNGKTFWNRLSLYPINGENGEPEYLVATQVDITSEKKAEAAQELANSRLRSSLSATSEGYLLVDPKGGVVFANHRYKDFFETPDAPFEEGADLAHVWAAYVEQSNSRQDDPKSAGRQRRDELFAGVRAREEVLDDGRVILLNDRPTSDGGAVSIATDVTSLKATERILAQRAAAIDASKDGIAVADDRGRLLYANDSYLAMYGYEHQYEILGKSWRTAFAEEDWHRIQTEAIPALQKDGVWRAELPGVSRTGASVPQEISVTYAKEVGVVCIARDIRQRVKARAEMDDLLQQVQIAQRQEAIGQLAAGVAHDFNNVLAAITGSAGLIDADLARGRDVSGHIERIQNAGVQAQGLIGRLLDFGARRSERVVAQLNDVLRKSYELLRNGVPARINLSIELPDEDIFALVDETDLTQIVLNLGINARDAIPGHGEIRISLQRMQTPPSSVQIGFVNPDADYAEITVSDSGRGISDDQIEQIFRAYYSTKGDKGTGLGLSVVSTIAKALGGAVRVTSEVGRGTTFTFYYPVDPILSVDDAQAIAPEADVQANLNGKLILVCDDQAGVAQTHAAMLETAGAETAVVEDPRDALEALQEDPDAWDALLTDFDMPHMTGGELAEAVRSARADLPIVVCSALDAHRRRHGLFDAELPKPATPEALILTLSAAIRARSPQSGT